MVNEVIKHERTFNDQISILEFHFIVDGFAVAVMAVGSIMLLLMIVVDGNAATVAVDIVVLYVNVVVVVAT